MSVSVKVRHGRMRPSTWPPHQLHRANILQATGRALTPISRSLASAPYCRSRILSENFPLLLSSLLRSDTCSLLHLNSHPREEKKAGPPLHQPANTLDDEHYFQPRFRKHWAPFTVPVATLGTKLSTPLADTAADIRALSYLSFQ